MPAALQTCTCGAVLSTLEGPVHSYMLSTPSCWHAYGLLLAREYEDPTRWATHRYAVDAYAVQHPGIDTPQARNSVGIHLSRLCLLFERCWPLQQANDAMLVITAKKIRLSLAHSTLTPRRRYGAECTRSTGRRVAHVVRHSLGRGRLGSVAGTSRNRAAVAPAATA